jgi:hypothetical protein
VASIPGAGGPDGALGPLHLPPADFCLYNMGLHELGIDPADVLPPLKPA